MLRIRIAGNGLRDRAMSLELKVNQFRNFNMVVECGPGRFFEEFTIGLAIGETRWLLAMTREQLVWILQGTNLGRCALKKCPPLGVETKMKKLAFAIVMCAAVGSPSAYAQTALPSTRPNVLAVQQDAVLSSKLIGLDVYDGANDKVGVITDLILEKSDLAGYILSVGGLLGAGDHYVAVTPGSIGYAYNETDKKWKASINVTKDDLRAAPQFFYEGKFKR